MGDGERVIYLLNVLYSDNPNLSKKVIDKILWKGAISSEDLMQLTEISPLFLRIISKLLYTTPQDLRKRVMKNGSLNCKVLIELIKWNHRHIIPITRVNIDNMLETP